MIRYINCIKRAAEISSADFARFWQDEIFVNMIKRTAELYKAEKWSMGLALSVEANTTILEMQDSAPPFDGMIEYCWKNGSDLSEIFQSQDGVRLFQEMTDYQSRFVDLQSSPQFFMQTEDD